MGRFVCLVPVLFARLSLALVYHVTVKGLLYCIMFQKPQSCPKGPQGLFPKKMSGVGKDRVVICPTGDHCALLRDKSKHIIYISFYVVLT